MKPTTEYCEDVCDGLVAYYPFFGYANDTSGNGLHGTVNGAVLTTDRDGNLNRSYSFESFEQSQLHWIQIDSVSKLWLENGSFTISMIAKVDRVPPIPIVMELIGTQSSSDGHFGISYHLYEGENFNNWFAVNQWPQDSAAHWRASNTLQYQHVVGVASRDTNSITLYVNGIQRAEDSWNGTFDGIVTAWVVGSSWSNHNGKFKLDELRFYNRDLSENEIQQIIGQ